MSTILVVDDEPKMRELLVRCEEWKARSEELAELRASLEAEVQEAALREKTMQLEVDALKAQVRCGLTRASPAVVSCFRRGAGPESIERRVTTWSPQVHRLTEHLNQAVSELESEARTSARSVAALPHAPPCLASAVNRPCPMTLNLWGDTEPVGCSVSRYIMDITHSRGLAP